MAIAADQVFKEKIEEQIFPLGRFLILLVTSLVLHFALLFGLPVFFSTSDDIVMQGLASGKLTGVPEEALVFVNVLLGKALAHLYTSYPDAPWYIVWFTITQSLGTAVWLNLLPAKVQPWQWVLSIAMLASITLYIQIDVQFTTTSFYILAAAGALAARLVQAGYDDFAWRWRIVSLCLGAGVLVRKENISGLVFILAPFLLYLFWTASHRGKLVYILFLLLIPITLLIGLDWNYYHNTPPWPSYFSFNSTRWQVQDNSFFYYAPAPALDKLVGWTATDHALVKLFYTDVTDKFSQSAFETYGNGLKEAATSSINMEAIGYLFQITITSFKYLSLFTVGLAVLCIFELDRKRALLCLLMLVSAFTMLAIIGQLLGIKDRLIVSALMATCLVLAAQLFTSTEPLKQKSKILLGGIVIIALFSLKGNLQNAFARKHMLQEEIGNLTNIPVAIGPKYMLSTSGFPQLLNNPLERNLLPAPWTDCQAVILGWLIRSPHQAKMMERAGLKTGESAILPLANARNGYAVLSQREAWLFARYMEENLGVEKVDTIGLGWTRPGLYKIYQFTTTPRQ